MQKKMNQEGGGDIDSEEDFAYDHSDAEESDGIFGSNGGLEDVEIDGDSVGREEIDSDEGPMEGSWEKAGAGEDEEEGEEDLLDDEQSFGSDGGLQEDSDMPYGDEEASEEEVQEAPKSKKSMKMKKKDNKNPMADFADFDDFAEMLENDENETAV